MSTAIAEPKDVTVVEEMSLVDAQRRLTHLEARRKLVLQTLNVSDVARLGDQLAKNKFAAEKLHEIFGGRFELLKDNQGKPLMDVQVIENDPDVGTYRVYTMFGRYELPNGKVIEQMGSFSTKDDFFAKAHGEYKNASEVSLVDVMQAAQTETYKKCIFRGVGLGYWTAEEAETLAGQAKGHTFGAKAGGAKDEAITMKWGRGKGKSIAQLDDKDLVFYLEAAQKELLDPEKAKFRKHNEKLVAALQAEQASRKDAKVSGTAAAPAGETQQAEAPPSPAGPLTRGQRCSAVFKRLAQFEHVRGSDLMQALVGKTSLSEISDDELSRLESLPDMELEAAAMALQERE